MARTFNRPDVEQFNELVLGLRDKPDRDVAIMGSSFLDLALELTIRTKLVGGYEDDYAALFEGGNAPVATFSAKIELAHGLALIDRRVKRECHLIRRIRNEFAHSIQDIDCTSEAIANRIHELEFAGPTNFDNPFGGGAATTREVSEPIWVVFPDGRTESAANTYLIVDTAGRVGFRVPTVPSEPQVALSNRELLVHSIWAAIAETVAPALEQWINGGPVDTLDDFCDR